MLMDKIFVSGGSVITGCYLLRLQANKSLSVQFGRFNSGQPISVPASTYLYIGSAMGKKGASTLAQRLLRHATRQNGNPQSIRPLLLARLCAAGLGTNCSQVPSQKTLFWHIDYLLEETAVDLTHIIIHRTTTSIENQLARLLANDPQTRPLANGLGASDDRGQSHLLHVPESLTWWQNQIDLVASTDSQNLY